MPAGHDVQFAWPIRLNVPAGQIWAAERPSPKQKDPDGQVVHPLDELRLKVPGGQFMQDVASGRLYEPPLQGMGAPEVVGHRYPAGHDVHEIEPLAFAYVPVEHAIGCNVGLGQ